MSRDNLPPETKIPTGLDPSLSSSLVSSRGGLVRIPDVRLRQASLPFVGNQRLLDPLLEKMFSVMEDNGGVGLAAVQVGVPLRIFVLQIEGEPTSYINPVLLAAHGWYHPGEGCLSVPHRRFSPPRPRIVNLSWQDRNGTGRSGWFSRLHAHTIAHELDHIDGLLLQDRCVLGPGVGSQPVCGGIR